jgi:predicted esterase
MENQSPLDVQLNLSIEVSDKRLILAPADGNYKYCLVWLHGLNMSVQKFYNVFLSEQLIGLLKDFKIILPQAPIAPVTVEKKSVFSWFNVTERKFGKPFDELFGRQEILDNSKTIIDIIDSEAKHLGGDYSKVFLGGFSAGCAMSTYVGLSIPQKLGGIIGYAGYFFEITPELSDDRNILIIHGTKDNIRPWEQVEPTYAPLKDKENVKFLLFTGMGHDLYSDDARKAVHDFIRERCK